MLDTLFFVPDIMTRYHCKTRDTARRYMRQMGATGSPLFVTEDMISDWEAQRTTKRDSTASKRRYPEEPGAMIIPRRK